MESCPSSRSASPCRTLDGDHATAPRPAIIPDAVRRVEVLGFESAWLAGLVVGDGTPFLDATLLLAAAAAVTERIRLGFGVLVLPLRPAAWTAAQVTCRTVTPPPSYAPPSARTLARPRQSRARRRCWREPPGRVEA
ncbi:MAG TPA: LLM class flavin-dependent oxidoreductase [Actinopolymorphaceae bacterium]